MGYCRCPFLKPGLDNPMHVTLGCAAAFGTISAVLWCRTLYLTGDDRYWWILILSIGTQIWVILMYFLLPDYSFDDGIIQEEMLRKNLDYPDVPLPAQLVPVRGGRLSAGPLLQLLSSLPPSCYGILVGLRIICG